MIKTELTDIGIKSKISQIVPSLTVSISGYEIPFSQSVRSLGFFFLFFFFLDEALSVDAHITYLCRILWCKLRGLGQIRPFLSTDDASKLAVSFILTSWPL